MTVLGWNLKAWVASSLPADTPKKKLDEQSSSHALSQVPKTGCQKSNGS